MWQIKKGGIWSLPIWEKFEIAEILSCDRIGGEMRHCIELLVPDPQECGKHKANKKEYLDRRSHCVKIPNKRKIHIHPA